MYERVRINPAALFHEESVIGVSDGTCKICKWMERTLHFNNNEYKYLFIHSEQDGASGNENARISLSFCKQKAEAW